MPDPIKLEVPAVGPSLWDRVKTFAGAAAVVLAIGGGFWTGAAAMAGKADRSDIDKLDARVKAAEILLPVVVEKIEDVKREVSYSRMDIHDALHGHKWGDPIAPPIQVPGPEPHPSPPPDLH